MDIRCLWLFLVTISLSTRVAGAPESMPTQMGPKVANPACSNPEYRQLDFWVGQWRVFDTAKGFRVGTSRIEPIMHGCAIKESYEAPQAPGGGYSGTSYSGFDRKDGKWHQLYVDVNGNVTWYTGSMEAGDMVLFATVKGGALQRMTYHRLPGRAVEQIGVISTDGGRTWKPGYDLTYRRDLRNDF